MKLQQYLLSEELTTTKVGGLGADSVTSNSFKLKMMDRKITQLVDFIKKKKNTKVTMKNGIATVDLGHKIPSELKKKLKQYMV